MAWNGNFKERIEDLAGSISDTSAAEQWLKDGCHEVFRRVGAIGNPGEISKFTTSSLSSSNAIDVSALRDISSVVRNGVACIEGTFALKNKYSDADSLYYPTSLTPVYYIEGQTLYIYPAPTSAEQAEYRYAAEYVLTNWDSSISSIANFPVKYYRAVMLYAATQLLHRKMLDIITVDPKINIVPMEPPSLPALSVSEAGANTIKISDLGTAPAYGYNASTDLGSVATYITDEDTELATAKIAEINTRMQDSLNTFNDANAEYQAMITQAQMNASAEKEDYAQTLAKYNAEISDYSAQVNAAVQEYTIKGQDYQWLSSTYARVKAEYEGFYSAQPQQTGAS